MRDIKSIVGYDSKETEFFLEPIYELHIVYFDPDQFTVESLGEDAVKIVRQDQPRNIITIENARELARRILHVTGKEGE